MLSTPADRPPSVGATQRMAVSHRIGLIAAVILTAVIARESASAPEPEAPQSLAEPNRKTPVPARPDGSPFFAQSWVSPEQHTASVHCSSVCVLPGGDLLALWYGGTREGAEDVAVFTSRLAPGASQWTEPVLAINRSRAQEELDRRVKKIGNTVIFPDQAGNLWMVYSSVSVGGWSGSSLNLKFSRDEGQTWGPSQRLTLNPFLNLSSLVRNKPIYASDGRIGLPVYHEMASKFPQMLWLTPGTDGTMEDYRMRSLPGADDLIQPTLVPLGEDRVLMMLRDSSDARRMRTAFSGDNGWTWDEATESELPNPDSALDALKLDDGRILLVYNHAVEGRSNLRLAISGDQGRSWQTAAVIEEQTDKEFSYPQLAEDGNGRIHLTYTWQRKRIKHVEFNVAWLDRSVTGGTASMP